MLKTEKRKTIRLTLLLATALLLTLTFAAQAFAFTDLTNSSVETQKAVDKLVELGILNGYIDNTFRPDDSINRAEFAKVASLALSQKTGVVMGAVQELDFADVSKNAWYAKDVANAVALGLMKGDAEGTFRPTDTVSNAEVITVLMRALGYTDADLQLTDKYYIELFMDSMSRTEAELQKLPWPDNYVCKAVEIGLLNENDDFLPILSCRRGQAATYVARMLNLPQADEEQTPPYQLDENDPLRQEYQFGVVTARTGETITITRFADGLQQTYHVSPNCDWQMNKLECTPGNVVAFQVSRAGSVSYVGKNNVATHNKREADLSGSKIKLNGKEFLLTTDTVVLLMNSAGGVSQVNLDRLQASDYVADLRSSDYRADVQYVTNKAGEITCLLIGDYRGQGQQMFGFVEQFGDGKDGTVVNFYGDNTDYIWKYVGKEGDQAPEENVLYAYRYRADGVEAYRVNVVDEQIRGTYGEGEIVRYAGDICLTESGKQFIVDSETQILKISLRSDGTIYDVTQEDAVYGGDRVRVRYTTKSGSNYTGLEAAYIIIIDTL